MLKNAIKMNNGIFIPQIGYGTYQIMDPAVIGKCVQWAWESGYRHIDTATFYKNEKAIGEALRKLSIPREEIFITSKIWIDDLSYDGAKRSIDGSLKRMQLDYIDLMLMHWPGADSVDNRNGCWQAMEEYVVSGKVKSIGVSNFLPRHLDSLLASCRIKPAVNQIEVNPLFFDHATIDYCKQHGILIEAYTPFAKGSQLLMEHPKLLEVAKAHDKTVGQVILRWLIQLGMVVLPKSETKERIFKNYHVRDFDLSEDEMKVISGMNQNKKTTWNPEVVPR